MSSVDTSIISILNCIYSRNNLGFGKANNQGTEVTKGARVLFLHSDTLLVNMATKILSDYLKHN